MCAPFANSPSKRKDFSNSHNYILTDSVAGGDMRLRAPPKGYGFPVLEGRIPMAIPAWVTAGDRGGPECCSSWFSFLFSSCHVWFCCLWLHSFYNSSFRTAMCRAPMNTTERSVCPWFHARQFCITQDLEIRKLFVPALSQDTCYGFNLVCPQQISWGALNFLRNGVSLSASYEISEVRWGQFLKT